MHARQCRMMLAVGLVVLGLLAVAPGDALAQEPPSVGVTVTGVGEATAPADTAHLQLLFATEDFFGGPVREEVGPDASPAAGEIDMEAALAPVVDALVAEGIDEAAITVVVSPIDSNRFGGGGAAGRLDFTVDDPTTEGLNNVLVVANDAAEEQGLSLDQVGAAYEIDDCAAVEREARQAAIEDARARADVQAELLGVQIGPVTASSDAPYFGLVGPTPCGFAEDGFSSSGPYDIPVTLSTYDPGIEPEVEVYVLLTLTFAIAQG